MVVLGILLTLLMPESGFRPAPRAGVGAVRAMASTGARRSRLLRARPLPALRHHGREPELEDAAAQARAAEAL
jgi:hypothetical protein